jgi:hypothetical protein
MDMKKILSNKWVWIGGAALGAVVLFTRGSSGGASSAGGVTAADYLNAQNQGMAYAVQQQQISTAAQTAMAQTNVQALTSFAGILQTMSQANAAVASENAQANAGIMNNILTTSAATAMDTSNNAAKDFTGLTAANAATKVAQINATAQQNIANTNANTSLWSGVAKDATSLISGGLKAFGL